MNNTLIERDIAATVSASFKFLPVVTLTGPRQSGKTTLCRRLFGRLPYVNLEDVSTLGEIEYDPKGFLEKYPDGLIIDEAQRFKDIFSYLQVAVDNDRMSDSTQRKFIVTGSSNFALMQSSAQSMAGRTAVLTLLPLSYREIKRRHADATTAQYILRGGYPAVWNAGDAGRDIILSNYYSTYVERDLRQLINVKDLHQFNMFVRLCAGRIGSEFNASALAVEVGVSVPTVKSWLSILETSYVAFLLPPYYSNIGKRLVKTPKIYFYDTGLAAWLMGINTVEQLEVHPLRGALFENMVVGELMKRKLNQGATPHLYFYRDKGQHEVDVLEEERDGVLRAYEIKVGKTFRADYFTQLSYLRDVLGDKLIATCVVYDGDQENLQQHGGIVNWRSL